MSAGARLVALSGLSGVSAGEHLRAIAGLASGTAAALLVAYSGLASGSAAEHLLAERTATPTMPSSLLAYAGGIIDQRPTAPRQRRMVEQQNQIILDLVLAMAAEGLLE